MTQTAQAKIRTNKAKRTITVTLPSGNKFRTMPLSKVDFNDLQFNTLNDWYSYLRHNEVIPLK